MHASTIFLQFGECGVMAERGVMGILAAKTKEKVTILLKYFFSSTRPSLIVLH